MKVLLDLETTSKCVFDAEIIELYAVVLDDNLNIVSEYEMKCNPLRWSDEAELIHGISKQEASKYNKFSEVYQSLLNWLVAYDVTEMWQYANVKMFGKRTYYDHAVLRLRMLDMGDVPYFSISKIKPYSVHSLVKILQSHYNFTDLKLESVCRTLGIDIKAHRAKNDVLATLEIMKRLMPLTTKEQISKYERGENETETDEPIQRNPKKSKRSTRTN